jgi:hypothetical protein
MAGESAHFGLRERPATPAVRPFDLPPRMQPMLDRAKAGLAEPFRAVAGDAAPLPGLFTVEKTGVSLAPVLDAAQALLAALGPDQRRAACFAIDDEAWRMWSNIHPWLCAMGCALPTSAARSARRRCGCCARV